MNNYWEDNIFPQFLQSIDSCTYGDYTDYQIQEQLNNLAVRAITDFKFPKVSLAYAWDTTVNTETGIPYGYYFTELTGNVAQREYNVIIARMKQYWIDFQMSQERLFYNAYYDKNISLHSPGNTLDKLTKMLSKFQSLADKAEYNYYRVNSTGTPAWGDINDD